MKEELETENEVLSIDMSAVTKPSVLIVCTANMCRSPMGEGILKHLVEARGDKDQWRIESGGVWADHGYAATKNAQVVMQNKGIDISAHQSQPTNRELLEQFNLILTMEKRHKESLWKAYPEYSSRVFMLSEMVGKEEDIDDPIGGELEDYQETAELLERILSTGLGRIYQLATVSPQNR